MRPNQTTAKHLLSLVFEGHDIRTVLRDGKPLFVATDVAASCGISKAYDVIKTHVEEHHLTSISLEVRSANGVRQNRSFQCVTQGGVFALVMGSRKPAARRFQNWLADEVLPQLLKYGTYAPGATAGERCAALHARWKAERSGELAAHGEALESSGLLTISAFRKIRPVADPLGFAMALRRLARAEGHEPARFYTGARRHTPAWPAALLAKAAAGSTLYLPMP